MGEMTVKDEAANDLFRKARDLVARAAKLRAEVTETRERTEQIMATARMLVGENRLEASQLTHNLPVHSSEADSCEAERP